MDALTVPDFSIYEATAPSPGPRQRRSNVYELPLTITRPFQRPSPESRRLMLRIRQLTGWSDRTLGSAVGASHPTIGNVLHARVTPRLGLRQRIATLHALVQRVSTVAGNEPEATDRALRTPIAGRNALAHLAEGEVGRAYLTALDALRPRMLPSQIIRERPARPGEATAAIHEE
jgi:hypothetical protein